MRRRGKARPLPTLVGRRVLLRARDLSDLDDLMEMDSDRTVMRFIRPVEPPLRRRRVLVQRICRRLPAGQGYWSVRTNDDAHSFLGWVVLARLPDHPAIEIGYRFRRQAWGKGYATEASRLLLLHAFESARLAAVAAVINAGNSRSRHVLWKLGFSYRGRRWAYGRWLPFFTLTRAAFRARSFSIL